jgi:hypothetical protein
LRALINAGMNHSKASEPAWRQRRNRRNARDRNRPRSAEETGLDVEVGPIVEILDRITRDANGNVGTISSWSTSCAAHRRRPGARCADAAEWVSLERLTAYGVAGVTVQGFARPSIAVSTRAIGHWCGEAPPALRCTSQT